MVLPPVFEALEQMKKPKLTLRFVPNAYTEEEGELEEIACFELIQSNSSNGLWGTKKKETVKFPNGDVIIVSSEVTPYGNNLHVHSTERRLCSIKGEGEFNVMFLLPSGEEAYAELSGL